MSAENPARRPWWRRQFGNRSEKMAEKFLKKLGYRLLARNWTCKLGELDIVARDADTVVFVEVRSTGSDDGLRPAQSVGYAKQKRLTKLAHFFLKQHQLFDCAARFDVLSIHWQDGDETPQIEHYIDAFEAVDL